MPLLSCAHTSKYDLPVYNMVHLDAWLACVLFLLMLGCQLDLANCLVKVRPFIAFLSTTSQTARRRSTLSYLNCNVIPRA